MSWFSSFFRKQPKNSKYAPNLDGWLPLYTQFGQDIYASDVVQQALSCIVSELKKLNPKHIRTKGDDPVLVKGDMQDLLNNPNELMTTSEFLEKISWLLLLNYNAFIIPSYYTWIENGVEKRKYTALWPIKPNQVDFIEDASGKLFIKFYFNAGVSTTLPYDDVIHVKLNYSVNEYMGGNEFGQPDHKALLKTLDLNKQMLEGVAKAMNASYAVNGVVQYNTMLDDGKTEAAIRDLEAKLKKSESGILPLDLKANFTPLERKAAIVDENTLKFIDEKILRHFGVPLPILTGDYTKDQYEAFYQKTLEPIIIAFAQAFTKKLFTEREKAFGNKIEFYAKELIFMSINQKIEMINLLAPTGAMYENEKRAILGLMPLPELEGKRYMSLNWVDADKANEYQLGKVNVDVVDKSETVTDEEV